MQIDDQIQARFQDAVNAHQRGDLADAEKHYRQVLDLCPGHSAACNNLGLCLAMADRVEEAADWFRKARVADPASADAVVNLAQALQQSNRADEALTVWREAAALLADHMEPALAAAMLAVTLGKLDDAIDDLEAAAGRTAQREGTRDLLLDQVGELASRCIDAGDLSRGHRLSSMLVRLAPDDGEALGLLEACLRHARIAHFDAQLQDDLLHYYRSNAVEHHELSRVACELLCARYPVLADAPPDTVISPWMQAGIHHDELLELLLMRGRVATAAMERSLTALRRTLARIAMQGALPDARWRRLATALALQCFTNEYVFSVTPEEQTWCTAFAGRLQENPDDLDALVAFACYRTPGALAEAKQLADRHRQGPGLIDELCLRTLIEPMRERALREAFAGSSPDNAVSMAVQRQYEESPYPRWQNLEHQATLDIARFLRQELPHHDCGPALGGAASILIAGCGTGEHALRVAARHPMCSVTAIDLSTASLAYGMRKAGELGIDNITFQHRDILSITASDGPFHLIESVGVIHHMGDPAAGLGTLVDALDDAGCMKLGLYSRQARRTVNAARARIRELGLDATSADMRTLRERILGGEEPRLEPLLFSLDFYAMSSVRDLLFHVQEHQYDVPELRGLIEGCGLRCVGFQVSPATRKRYLDRFPDDAPMTDLDHWHDLEREFPDTFAGMYQFWCVRHPP